MGTRRRYNPVNWGKKLTEDQVLEIRRQLRQGDHEKHIAESFDISRTMLTRIKEYRMWRDAS